MNLKKKQQEKAPVVDVWKQSPTNKDIEINQKGEMRTKDMTPPLEPIIYNSDGWGVFYNPDGTWSIQ